MKKYNLWFISDKDLYKHIKDTVEKYRFSITLDDFKKNLIDPIKLTFNEAVWLFEEYNIRYHRYCAMD